MRSLVALSLVLIGCQAHVKIDSKPSQVEAAISAPKPEPESDEDHLKRCLQMQAVVRFDHKAWALSGKNVCDTRLRAVDVTIKFYENQLRIGSDIVLVLALDPGEMFTHKWPIKSDVLEQGTPDEVRVTHE